VTDDDEYDWLHNNHIPMFQLSKASEDSFDCEFYNMSPLQSFSLCMAIFLSFSWCLFFVRKRFS
jgi:hypothetical protein